MAAIHGKSHKALRHFRDTPAALAVYWVYVSRANYENVAWPSIPGLARDTGWSKDSCLEARHWLVECGALERVADYVRPEWRNLDRATLTRRRNFDRAEYYRPTGTLFVAGARHEMLYFGGSETSDIEEASSDVRQERTSDRSGHPTGADIRPGRKELDSIPQLDSKTPELATTTTTSGGGGRSLTFEEQVREAAKAYEQNIGLLTPMMKDQISAAVEEYGGEWCVEAIRVAVGREKRFWSFVEGVLKRWKRDGKDVQPNSTIPPHEETEQLPSPSPEKQAEIEARVRRLSEKGKVS